MMKTCKIPAPLAGERQGEGHQKLGFLLTLIPPHPGGESQ